MRSFAPLVFLALTACPYVGDGKYGRDIQDADGDGAIGVRFDGPDCRDDDASVTTCDADADLHLDVAFGGDDCDDADATVFVGAPETCDALDNDCDGQIDDADPDRVDPATFYVDADADGYGNGARPVLGCQPAAGAVVDGTDCDDADGDTNPAAPELCDAADRDCDGDPTAGATDPLVFYVDADHDGWGTDVESSRGCEAPDGEAPRVASDPIDCDDADPLAHPGAVEVFYDEIDQDCLGGDDWDADADGYTTAPGVFVDRDCDDVRDDIHPNAQEICDGGLDDDCDGLADDADPQVSDEGRFVYLPDTDGDGFGTDLLPARFCPGSNPAGFVLLGGDCDDSLASISPTDVEVCDERDNDCNGAIDDGAVDTIDAFADLDGDGHGSAPAVVCALGPALADVGDDCNDADPTIYPGAFEVCGDPVRQDCQAVSPWDCDADGHDGPEVSGDDCDDTEPTAFPGASEVCDGVDNDCDGLGDDVDPTVDPTTRTTWFNDADGDGYGSGVVVASDTCYPGPGAATNRRDCDDGDAARNPAAPEVCDGEDDDCDGAIDDSPAEPLVWHLDADLDGFGDPLASSATGCEAPIDGNTWRLDGTDCDDAELGVNPLAIEVCNAFDDDCDAVIDDADGSVQGATWYRDQDADGYGQQGSIVLGCAQPTGTSATSDDCNDRLANVNPLATEVCNAGIDDDCDGLTDTSDPGLVGGSTFHADADGDGFGDATAPVNGCTQPPGAVANDDDCFDADPRVSPDAAEVCNTIDDDCDGRIDGDDGAALGPVWFLDEDDDGVGGGTAHACGPGPTGVWSAIGGDDCDDDPARTPGNAELCDGIDNDCDGLTDDADPGLADGGRWAEDLDGDGLAGTSGLVVACAQPLGLLSVDPPDCDDGSALILGIERVYVDSDGDGFGAGGQFTACYDLTEHARRNGDCDDALPAANPFSPELCDGYDNDCDGDVDDVALLFVDNDGDGVGSGVASFACPDATFVVDGNDCDDADPAQYPGAPELCDGVDSDCDFRADEADAPADTHYADLDHDGFGGGAPLPYCDPNAPITWMDCNDHDVAVHIGASERCNGVDDDCDLLLDDADTVDVGLQLHADADDDGFGDSDAPLVGCAEGPGRVANADDCDDLDGRRYPGQIVQVGAGLDYLDPDDALADGPWCDGGELQIAPGDYDWFAVLDGDWPGVAIRGMSSTARPVIHGGGPQVFAILLNSSGPVEISDVIVDGDGASPGVHQDGPGRATLVDVLIRDTDAAGSDGSGADYGALVVHAPTTLVDVEFDGHRGVQYGGANLVVRDELEWFGGRVEHGTGSSALWGFGGSVYVQDVDFYGNPLYPLIDHELATDFTLEDCYATEAPGFMRLYAGPSVNIRRLRTEGIPYPIAFDYGPVTYVEVRESELLGVLYGISVQSGLVQMNVTDTVIVGASGGVGINVVGGDNPVIGLYNDTFAELEYGILQNSFQGTATYAPVDGLLFDTYSYDIYVAGPVAGALTGSTGNGLGNVPVSDVGFVHLTRVGPDIPYSQWDPAPDCQTYELGACPYVEDGTHFRGQHGFTASRRTYYADTDADGLLDGWELRALGSLVYDANDDPDHDLLNNGGEYAWGWDPSDPDTDNDGTIDPLQPPG